MGTGLPPGVYGAAGDAATAALNAAATATADATPLQGIRSFLSATGARMPLYRASEAFCQPRGPEWCKTERTPTPKTNKYKNVAEFEQVGVV
jgi:hypothetical protein